MTDQAQALAAPTPAAIRAELEQLVLADLLGPAGGPEEELSESVRDRYLLGMLAPRRQQVLPEMQDDLPAADDAPRMARSTGPPRRPRRCSPPRSA